MTDSIKTDKTETSDAVANPVDVVVSNRDWQVTAILGGNLFIETDCNSGDKRRIKKSMCKCGKPVLIEYNTTGFRADGKRIFYPDRDEDGYHVFRCDQCRQPVSESVPGAEYEEERTARERAGIVAANALDQLAQELEADGKSYGAAEIKKMKAEATRWSQCC